MHTLESLLQLSQAPEGKQKLQVILGELLGWSFHPPSMSTVPKWEALACWVSPGGDVWKTGFIANWPEDLNACHEVEASLTGNSKSLYGDRLADVIGFDDDYYVKRDQIGDRMYHVNSYTMREFACATALHRTVALILTLQKP